MENNPIDQGIFNSNSEHFADFRQNADRAQLAITFIWITTGFRLLDAVFQYNLITKLQDFSFLNYSEDKMQAIQKAESTLRIVEISSGIVYIITGIIFIRWFRRAYFNLNCFANKKYTDGWAAGAWFVPIISWFRPYQIMQELFEKTSEHLNERGVSTDTNYGTPIGVWWTFWVILNITDSICARITPETTSGFINLGWANIVSSLGYFGLAFLITKIIRNYNSLETQLN